MSTNDFRTEQEAFWAGEFGNAYTRRNHNDDRIVPSNTALFARILRSTTAVRSVIEFGANVGLNLRAIQHLLPAATFTGVEINAAAVAELRQLAGVTVHHGSLLDYAAAARADFVLSKGVLIHINPNFLPAAYDVLYHSSARYICVVEYYSPSPTAIPYRGHAERLFKRDFAGEMIDRFAGLRLMDYGFVYRRDPNFPLDDVNWFLLERAD